MRSFLFLLVFATFSSSLLAFQDQDTLRIGVYESPPFIIYSESDEVEGISGWIWKQVIKEIDRPYKIIKYTTEEPLNDIISDLETGNIDLSINPITITASRDEAISFSYPFFIGDLSIAKKQTSTIDSIFTILKSIFNKRVLVLILLLISFVILFGIVIWLIEKKNQHFERGFQGFLTSLWWSVVTMTTVGYGDKVPISNAGRLVAVLWMLCALITVSIFTASITSTLTVRELAYTDYSLDNFKQNKIGTVSGSATEEFLKRNFFRHVKVYPEFKNGLNSLNKGDIELFIYDRSWLLYQINNNTEFSSLELLPYRFKMQQYAIPMKKNIEVELQKNISSAIIQSMELKEWDLLLKEFDLHQD